MQLNSTPITNTPPHMNLSILNLKSTLVNNTDLTDLLNLSFHGIHTGSDMTSKTISTTHRPRATWANQRAPLWTTSTRANPKAPLHHYSAQASQKALVRPPQPWESLILPLLFHCQGRAPTNQSPLHPLGIAPSCPPRMSYHHHCQNHHHQMDYPFSLWMIL
jgi:hypothetical protein